MRSSPISLGIVFIVLAAFPVFGVAGGHFGPLGYPLVCMLALAGVLVMLSLKIAFPVGLLASVATLVVSLLDWKGIGGGNLGPYRGEVRRLGLGDHVKLIGFVDDVRTCYHASDFFVLPTYYDPCALVVFEALACGLPVVTTAQNGAGELIAEGVEGFVVPSPDRAGALADAMDALSRDDLRRAMSAAATRLGLRQSLDNHVSRLVAVFGEVAATKRARTPHEIWSHRLVD